MRRFIVLFIVILASISMFSCTFVWGPTTTTSQVVDTTTENQFSDLVILDQERYIVEQVDEGYEYISSYYDGEFYYYYFYIGNVSNFPIAWGTSHYFNGIAFSFTYGRTEITTTSISESMAYMESNTTSMSSTVSRTVSGQIGSDDVAKVGYEKAWEDITQTSSQISQSSTYEVVHQWQSATSETVLCYLDNSYPNGYYRYTLYATSDIYLSLAYNVSEGTYYYDYIADTDPTSLHDVIDYSQTGDYPKTSEILFEIASDVLEDLPEPTQFIYNPAIAGSVIIELNPQNCKLDNHYDVSVSDSNEISKNEINPNIVELLLTNVVIGPNNQYYLGENWGINLVLIQDVSNIELTGYPDSTATSSKMIDDSMKIVNGTNIDSAVKMGGIYILVTYTDLTTSEFFDVDIFDGLSENSTISLLEIFTPNVSKTIKSISISIVYEIQTWWPGFIFDGYTLTNWRCDIDLLIAEED